MGFSRECAAALRTHRGTARAGSHKPNAQCHNHKRGAGEDIRASPPPWRQHHRRRSRSGTGPRSNVPSAVSSLRGRRQAAHTSAGVLNDGRGRRVHSAHCAATAITVERNTPHSKPTTPASPQSTTRHYRVPPSLVVSPRYPPRPARFNAATDRSPSSQPPPPAPTGSQLKF